MARRSKTPLKSYNDSVREEHARLVGEIIARRPHWSAEKLAAIGKTYGSVDAPGLDDILDVIKQADRFNTEFAGEPEGWFCYGCGQPDNKGDACSHCGCVQKD